MKLEKANVVFDSGKLVLNSDMPFLIGDIDLLASDLKNWNVKGQVIAVFHGDATYLVLNDAAYDATVIFKPVILFKPGTRTESSSPG